MENRVVNTKDLALLFDGNKAMFGLVFTDRNLFVNKDRASYYRYSSTQFNKGVSTKDSSVITLNALYSKDMPEILRAQLRNTLGALEDATLLCIYEKGEVELKDLLKVELFLTQSLKARKYEEEAKKMFEESVMPILEGENEMF